MNPFYTLSPHVFDIGFNDIHIMELMIMIKLPPSSEIVEQCFLSRGLQSFKNRAIILIFH